MSGLAGFWNRDGRPADPGIAESMAAAVAHRGDDYRGAWSGGTACAACRLRRVTPESASERQPVVDDNGRVLLFDGRLDNRDEIIKAIKGREHPERLPDSELLLAAWGEHGSGVLSTLQGDFAFAVFDPGADTLVLARDPVGCRPLCYWSDNRTVAFASEIKSLLAHPPVRARPNAELIADFLLLERLPYEDEGETFFDGVRAVLPGQRLIVTPDRMRSERFWDFNPSAQLRYRTYAEYCEHLRDLLVVAVKRRLRSQRPVAIAASGGLDSSAIVCIANELRRRGDLVADVLPAGCFAPDAEASDEGQPMAAIESTRGLAVRRLPFGALPLASEVTASIAASEVPQFDQGWHALGPILTHARAAGAATLVTGMWSDQLFFVTGYLTDLFRQLAWRERARHLAEYSRWFPDADPAYFRSRARRELILHLTPQPLRARLRPLYAGLRRLRQPVEGDLAALARRRRRRVVHPRYATAHARNLHQGVRAKARRLQFEADEKIVAAHHLEHATPFLDRDVIAFLMAIPGDVQNHHGVPRALLRDALRGLVPDPVLVRRWRDVSTAQQPALDQAMAALCTQTELTGVRSLGLLAGVERSPAASIDIVALEYWCREFFGMLSPA